MYGAIGLVLVLVNYRRNVRRIAKEEEEREEDKDKNQKEKAQRFSQFYEHFLKQGLL